MLKEILKLCERCVPAAPPTLSGACLLAIAALVILTCYGHSDFAGPTLSRSWRDMASQLG